MKEKTARTPSLTVSLIILLLVIAVVIVGSWLGIGMEMALFLGALVAIISCLCLKMPWADVEASLFKSLSDMLVPILILIDVGIMVGAWIIGGTVPSLMYYGLKLVSPAAVLPLAFVLCALMSIFTGTSFGSIATMGLALTGVAAGAGVPIPMVVGAVVAGAHVGDKMSPMSDSTNLASAVTGAKLYDHIGSMMYTTIPAALISLAIYIILGMRYASGGASMDDIELMLQTLDGNFHISLIALIPAILMLVVSVLKIPAILGLSCCAVFSLVFASVLQGVSLVDVMSAGLNGYVSDTGVAMVDTILSRGGLLSMMGTVALVLLAGLMGGALQASGVLTVIVQKGLMRMVRSARSLVISTMLYCYTILFVSGNQMLGAIITGPTFEEAYDEMDVDRKVLSRAIGDTTIVGSGLVPWGVTAVYTMGVLGCDASFIPYEFFCYIVPIFTVICALTGFATWHKDGTPYWKKGAQAGKGTNGQKGNG